jgi:trk system potassium uptake protein TrkH
MGMKRKKRASRRRGWLLGSSATQVICISFVLLIALGTLLLTLPISSRSGRLGVVDAMFTATSATCVTGLVVRDTWTQFTPFGQAVVLLLIQVGGLGLVTLTSFFALAAKRRMGFKDLRLLGESVSASGYSQATDVLKIVVKLAMTFEIIGMVLLMIAFVPQFGAEGIWISAFTAISAFCNAGFDLFGRFGQYSSLAPYVSNYYVQAVIMFLIMAGGLGFMVWVEIGEWRKKRHLSLHARMVLLFSCILWVGGAVLIGLMEWNNPKSMGGLSVPGKVMAALFQSVSTRTAGMNTIDLAACGPITKLLMSVLQFIGAAPGSTGGGVKVTTFAVLILTMRSVAQGRDGGLRLQPGILGIGAGGLPPQSHRAQGGLIQFLFGTHKSSLFCRRVRLFAERTAAGSVLEKIVSAGFGAVHPEVPAGTHPGHRAPHIVDGAQALGIPGLEDAVPVPEIPLGPGLYGGFLHHGIIVAVDLVPAGNGLAPAKGQLGVGNAKQAADVLLPLGAQGQQLEVCVGLFAGLHTLGPPDLQFVADGTHRPLAPAGHVGHAEHDSLGCKGLLHIEIHQFFHFGVGQRTGKAGLGAVDEGGDHGVGAAGRCDLAPGHGGRGCGLLARGGVLLVPFQQTCTGPEGQGTLGGHLAAEL